MLLPFPAANRDPEFFEQADEVIIDRAKNRHAAFGLGIHRCLGSNLARMELRVAIEEWLAAYPEFSLADGTRIGQGRNKACEFLAENKDVAVELDKGIRQRLVPQEGTPEPEDAGPPED